METVTALGLKRRYEEVDVGSPCSTPKDSDDDISSSDSADSCDSLNAPSSSHTRKEPKYTHVDISLVQQEQWREVFMRALPHTEAHDLQCMRRDCTLFVFTVSMHRPQAVPFNLVNVGSGLNLS